MENIKQVTNSLDDSVYIIIDRGNNEFTSMTKEHYEATYGPIEEEVE
jgi:hypothetical protein